MAQQVSGGYSSTDEWVVAVDAGALESAQAHFSAAVLARVGSSAHALFEGDRVVVEIPQADGRGSTVDDLIRVTAGGVYVACRSMFGPSAQYAQVTPRHWKGSLPKAVCHLRMWQALSDTERALLGGEQTAKAIANACNRGAKARWKKHANHHYSNRDLPKVAGLKITHDILDAVSLGLWYLGRLNLAAVTKG